MNKNVMLIVVVSMLVIVGGVTYFVMSKDDGAPVVNESSQTTESEEVIPTVTSVYNLSGVLSDVSDSGSSGVVDASYYSNGDYELFAEFHDLAPTTNGDFYEGWLVNRETKEFFSTGKTVIDPAGTTVNSYKGDKDYQKQGYDFYVLTLEPDDGDPAPAKHIVEGPLTSEQ